MNRSLTYSSWNSSKSWNQTLFLSSMRERAKMIQTVWGSTALSLRLDLGHLYPGTHFCLEFIWRYLWRNRWLAITMSMVDHDPEDSCHEGINQAILLLITQGQQKQGWIGIKAKEEYINLLTFLAFYQREKNKEIYRVNVSQTKFTENNRCNHAYKLISRPTPLQPIYLTLPLP